MTQFGRAYRLTIGQTEIDARTGVGAEGMRIAFQIERTTTREPNNAEIRVWNYSRATRESLGKLANVPVLLEAGYVDDVGVLFSGDLRSARTRREGPDLVTCVSGGDGESAIRTAKLSRTFAAGTPTGTVILELGRAMGVKPGNLGEFAAQALRQGSRTLRRGLTVHGSVYDELEAFCRSCGLRWCIQDSALQLRPAGAPVNPGRGPLLRPDAGLISEVEVETLSKPEGDFPAGSRKVTGRALLRPDLVPGTAFRVESEAFTGACVCKATTHAGDTHSTEPWYVEFSGIVY